MHLSIGYNVIMAACVLGSCVLGCCTPSWADSPTAIEFDRDIAPLFQKYCVSCHSSDDTQGELLLDTFEGLLHGGEHGAILTPGEPNSSRMLLMASGKLEPKMPPDDQPGLTEAELELLSRWISEGAAGPTGAATSPKMLITPNIESTSQQPRPISALALSPDNTLLAIARDRKIEIVRADNNAMVRSIPAQADRVNDLSFSADGDTLVVASGTTGLSGLVLLVNVADGSVDKAIVGHRDTIYSARISPSGEILATAGYDRDIHLWQVSSGELLRTLKGHNGAVSQLAFSHDGNVLASASADETVKLWRVSDGERLDTLSQPQGEVWSVAFSPNDRFIVAGSADNRFRIWRFESKTEPRINTLIDTRFADESPLVRLAFTPDGKKLVIASQAGRLPVFETSHWNKLGSLPEINDVVTALVLPSSNDHVLVGSMSGDVVNSSFSTLPNNIAEPQQPLEEIYVVVDAISEVDEPTDIGHATAATAAAIPRGATVKGSVRSSEDGAAEVDWYRFTAKRGEVWMIETRAAQDGSPLDSVIEVCDAAGGSIPRIRLQAIRDTYFTFRGKDSTQSTDFRLFAWEEMELNDFLYSAGEVTRLWMYPRGPDSGFNVYPGTGNRRTFFDTTAITHALQDPAYIVRPLAADQAPADNGLPVFELFYLNDDDAERQLGSDSRVRFVAPNDGQYTIRVTDARQQGSDASLYKLTLRPADPNYVARVDAIAKPIPAGAGREFRVYVTRKDGFEGPIEFYIAGLPSELQATEIVTVEAGQDEAYGVVWGKRDLVPDQKFAAPQVIARAEILGRTIEHVAGSLGELQTSGPQQVVLSIQSKDESEENHSGDDLPSLSVRAGETISAFVYADRINNDGEIKLGNEFAGRNMSHGVFVDNIGLSGLIILKGTDHQPFFITAAAIAKPGKRYFHLKSDIDGGITSPPMLLEVQPAN